MTDRKEHHKEYVRKNAEKVQEYLKSYRKENKNRIKQQRVVYYQNHKHEWKRGRSQYNPLQRRKYTTANLHKVNLWGANRRARKLCATPRWVNYSEIEVFYYVARTLTELIGIQYVVDHVIPLKNPLVSGLHVPWNLQILTSKENSEKGNKL